MNEYTRKHPSHDCEPPEYPADQPKPPTDGEDCKEPDPITPPPTWENPEPCWTHDPCCNCPTEPEEPQNCLQELIAKQAGDIVLAKKADEFKGVLEGLLQNADVVRQKYTRDQYDKLVDDWLKQDAAIAELIRKLVCAVPCWKCIMDCYVCPLINEIYVAEKSLYDDGKFCADVHDVYDLQYWHQRNKDAKQRTFDRIKKVIDAWKSPAETITEVIAKNQTLIEKCSAVIGTEPGKAIYDVFLVLVPMHLAIAPPAHRKTPTGQDTTTRIASKYTEFCPCEKIDPENCCGPDVGPWTVRQQLIQPQPYLINPNEYFKLICCLVKKFYGPAQDALTKAAADLAEATQRVETAKKKYEEGLKNFGTIAGNAIPKVIDCCDYDKDDDEHHGSSQSS